MPALDLSAIAGACYDLASEDAVWLLGIVNVLQPWLDRGLGIAAWSFRVGDWACSRAPSGVDPKLGHALCTVGRALSSELKSRFFGGPRAQPCCERIGNTTGLDRDRAFEPLWPFRIRDFHVLTLLDDMGMGLAFLAPEFHVIRGDAATTRNLARVGTHVLAAFRLRRLLRKLRADAVAELRELAQRAPLQHAVEVFDRMGSKPGLGDWEAARSIWQGLMVGHWSLVQSFESRERRYLLARSNPATASTSSSSVRPLASEALWLRASGTSYKCIAAELGISIACAHQLVKGACQRLGVRDESELSQLLPSARVLGARI